MTPAASIAVRLMKWSAIGIAILIVLYAVIVAFFDFNVLRGPIERFVSERTGRELNIRGDLDLTWGWPLPRIRVEDVSFANPAWAREKNLFSVDKAEVAVSLPRLLAGKLHLTEVLAAGPRAALEISDDGRKSWLLDPGQHNEQSNVGIDRRRIDRGRLIFVDRVRHTDLAANFSVGSQGSGAAGVEEQRSAKGDGPGTQAERSPAGLKFDVQGRYKGVPVTASGSGGSVLTLRDVNADYPLSASGRYGDNRIKASGSVKGLTQLKEAQLDIAVAGDELHQLASLVGAPALPQIGRYETRGRVRRNGSVWAYERFTARIGQSDLAGDLRVDTARKPLALSADLHAKELRLADLLAPSGSRDKSEKSEGLFPDAPFSVERWDALDADVKLQADAIFAGRVELKDLDTAFSMKGGTMQLQPLNARLAGGAVRGHLRVQGKDEAAQGEIDVRLSGVKLNELLPGPAKRSIEGKAETGRMDAGLKLSGTGTSVDELLGSSDGRVTVILNGGQVSNFVLEALGLDLWEMLRLKVAGDRGIPIRCGVADFTVKDGLMQTRAAVLDTEDTKVSLTGSVNLGRETMDLTIYPVPKDVSPLALREPIHLRGPLADPDIKIDKARMTAKAAGALALGLVNPLLALLPLIETGPGVDSDCGKLIHEAKDALPTAPTK